MIAGKRQYRGEIVLMAALDAVAGAAGRDLRQVVPAADRQKFARQHVVHGRRWGAAVDADFANVPLAHERSIP